MLSKKKIKSPFTEAYLTEMYLFFCGDNYIIR